MVPEPIVLHAPAKLNLGLRVGGRRDDGMHQIASLFVPLLLGDRITVGTVREPPVGGADQVVCPAVSGPNIVEPALAALRRGGWRGPPLRVEIEKRIPIAAGLGGGSADAAALLSIAATEAGGIARRALPRAQVAEIALRLGADVPSQLSPRAQLVGGIGEVFEPTPAPRSLGVVLIPNPEGLGAGQVYATADRLGSTISATELARASERMRALSANSGWDPRDTPEAMVNDLEPAACALRPAIAEVLEILREIGAGVAAVSGSGPTVYGLFDDRAAAEIAAAALPNRYAAAIVTAIDPGVGR